MNCIEYHPYPICRPVTVSTKRQVIPKISLYNTFDREKLKTPKLCYPAISMVHSDKSNLDSNHVVECENQVSINP